MKDEPIGTIVNGSCHLKQSREVNLTARIQLLSIQVGLPQEWSGSDSTGFGPPVWVTSFHKRLVNGSVWVGKANIDGDRAGASTHGGPEKVVCVYPWEHYAYWQRELSLPELTYGAFAENFTVQGQLEDQACIGDVVRVGEAEIQISQPRPPCWRLARWWQRKSFVTRMEETGRTGWYCRVIKEGYAEAGISMELIDRPHPDLTVSVANQFLYGNGGHLDRLEMLASCSLLSDSWRESLLARRARLTRSN